MQLVEASTAEHISIARTLFEEYAAAIEIDLTFQNLADELADLPGTYAPPRGRLMIAWGNDVAAGCVALRPIAESVCEMKRLYVRPAFRGQGIGMRLAGWIVAEARRIGYTRMRLDTLPSMGTAKSLYESLGFERCQAYYETPLSGTIFMELSL
jgi:GNAT superfamily N-acetyltransferase